MEDRLEKGRTVSTASSTSSVTEYVNEGFDQSEMHPVYANKGYGQSYIQEKGKKVVIEVTDDVKFVKNPMGHSSSDPDSDRSLQNLADFTPEHELSASTGKNFKKMYVAALVVLMFAICMGVTATYSATATMDMQKPHSSIHPSPDEVTWIGSLMAVGALVGGGAAGTTSHKNINH